VERMLTEIDELPEQFKSAEIVYISKNNLTNLEVRASAAAASMNRIGVPCSNIILDNASNWDAAKAVHPVNNPLHSWGGTGGSHCSVWFDMQGVQQFTCLRVLSAADNLLPDISCLDVLSACPNLQVGTIVECSASCPAAWTHGQCPSSLSAGLGCVLLPRLGHVTAELSSAGLHCRLWRFSR